MATHTMSTISRICLSGIGMLLFIAAIMKIIDAAPSESVMAMFGISAPWNGYVIAVIASVELMLGILLLAQVHTISVLLSAFVLLGSFTTVLVRLVVLRSESSCACFGTSLGRVLGESPEAGVLRNALLMAVVGSAIVLRLLSIRSKEVTATAGILL